MQGKLQFQRLENCLLFHVDRSTSTLEMRKQLTCDSVIPRSLTRNRDGANNESNYLAELFAFVLRYCGSMLADICRWQFKEQNFKLKINFNMKNETSTNRRTANGIISGVISRLTMKQILEYECHSHWLASWISFNWGQELIAWYIARKVARKYKRYLYSLESRERLTNGL